MCDSGEPERAGRIWAITIDLNILSKYLSSFDPPVAYCPIRMKTVPTMHAEVFYGNIHPKEGDCTVEKSYTHAHCGVKDYKGPIEKKRALKVLATSFGLDPKTFLIPADDPIRKQIITYCQRCKNWNSYKEYAFESRFNPESEEGKTKKSHKDEVMTALSKEFKLKRGRLPNYHELMTLIVKKEGSERATAYIKAAEIFCSFADLSDDEKNDDDDDDDGEPKAKRKKMSNRIELSYVEEADVRTRLASLIDCMTYTMNCMLTRNKVEVVTEILLPLISDRHEADTTTQSLYLFGDSGAGKSFWPRLLSKLNLIKDVPTDADGTARFALQRGQCGWLVDECNARWFLSANNFATLKSIADGGRTSVKVHSGSQSVSGWLICTTNDRGLPCICRDEECICEKCATCRPVIRRFKAIDFVYDEEMFPRPETYCFDLSKQPEKLMIAYLYYTNHCQYVTNMYLEGCLKMITEAGIVMRNKHFSIIDIRLIDLIACVFERQ